MDFLAFSVLVWLLLAGLAYAGWMLRDAWKKRRSIAEPDARPRFSRLFPTREIASQVIMAVGVCAVVGYVLQTILRDDSFQTARDQTMSWIASRNPNEPSDKESSGRIPDWLLGHCDFRPGRPVTDTNVGGLPITNEHLEWMVQEYPDLESVVLSQTKVTDDGIASLARLKSLDMVALDRVRLTDAGLAHLATLANLRELSLRGCRLSDTGIAHLRSLRNLRKLGLRDTQVTDVGLASLASMTELQELDLSGTAITEAGLRQLETLPKLQNVLTYDTAIHANRRSP